MIRYDMIQYHIIYIYYTISHAHLQTHTHNQTNIRINDIIIHRALSHHYCDVVSYCMMQN